MLTAKEAVLDYMAEQENEQKIFEDRSQGILDVHCGRHCVPRMEVNTCIFKDYNTGNIELKLDL